MHARRANEAKILLLQNAAEQQFNNFRSCLSEQVNKYKEKRIYTSRKNKYDAKFAVDPAFQKHARLSDVENLENIINNAGSATELNDNMLAYINGKANFKGLGHFSSLRSGLNSAIKKYTKQFKPADIDKNRGLLVDEDVGAAGDANPVIQPVVEVRDIRVEQQPAPVIVHSPVVPKSKIVEEYKEKANKDEAEKIARLHEENAAQKLHSQRVAILEEENQSLSRTLAQKDEQIQRLKTESAQNKRKLANAEKKLKATSETLKQQTDRNNELLDLIDVRDQHIAARDEHNSRLKETLIETRAEFKAFVEMHNDYVIKTNKVIEAFKAIIDMLKSMLYNSTRNDESKKLFGKNKVKQEAKKYRDNIRVQMKERKGEHFNTITQLTTESVSVPESLTAQKMHEYKITQSAKSLDIKEAEVKTIVEHNPSDGLPKIEKTPAPVLPAYIEVSDDDLDVSRDEDQPPPVPVRDDVSDEEKAPANQSPMPIVSATVHTGSSVPDAPPPPVPGFVVKRASTPDTKPAVVKKEAGVGQSNATLFSAASLQAKLETLRKVDHEQIKAQQAEQKVKEDSAAYLAQALGKIRPSFVPVNADGDSDDEGWRAVPKF